MSDNQNNEQQINIEISEEVADGTYSNLAIITHSNSEFIVDFIKIMPGTPKSKVQSRIILTPQHAKRLRDALNDNLHKFEEMHGEIKDNGPQQPPIPLNFGGPAGQA